MVSVAPFKRAVSSFTHVLKPCWFAIASSCARRLAARKFLFLSTHFGFGAFSVSMFFLPCSILRQFITWLMDKKLRPPLWRHIYFRDIHPVDHADVVLQVAPLVQLPKNFHLVTTGVIPPTSSRVFVPSYSAQGAQLSGCQLLALHGRPSPSLTRSHASEKGIGLIGFAASNASTRLSRLITDSSLYFPPTVHVGLLPASTP